MPDAAALREALDLWAPTAGGRPSLINLSENATYRVEAPEGATILRVHRQGYQTDAAIESELDWLAALDGVLPVPRVIAGRDGARLQVLGSGQRAVAFALIAGAEPSETGELGALFRTLGAYAATLHRQAAAWRRPASFVRPRLDAAALIGPEALWGDWRAAPGVTGEVVEVLETLAARLQAVLADYGAGPDRFGLIHADMRLANLLVEGDAVALIDFDDCGFGWRMYDLAAGLSFIEMRPDLDALIDAWLNGYRTVTPLNAADVAIIKPMILVRRLTLLAWIGSHGETPLAQRHAPHFAHDTAALAARLLP